MTAVPDAVGTLDPTLALVLDAPRLGEALGRPVTVTRLRHKPGVDTLAALADPAGQVAGWARVSHREARADRDRRRLSAGVQRRSLAGDLHLSAGDVAHDPRLAEGLGRPVTVTRLRHKPGVDTLAALADPSGQVAGWARVSHRAARADRDRRRLGAGVQRRPLAGDLHLSAGDVAHDPRLAEHLAGLLVDPFAPAEGDADLPRVLRYNPARRVVVRRGDHVLRVTAGRQPDRTRLLEAAGRAGVAVAGPGVAVTAHASRWPWVPGVDLGHRLDPAAARETGRELAGWHALGRCVEGVEVPTRDPAQERRRLRRAAADLADVHAVLGRRAGELVDRLDPLADVPPVPALLHGDLSADQVVVTGGGPVLLDLDRVAVGDAHVDLGSFAAVEMLGASSADPGLTEHLLDGWSHATGLAPDPRRLRQATAEALLARVGEPLRRAHPRWVDEVARGLDLVAEVLS